MQATKIWCLCSKSSKDPTAINLESVERDSSRWLRWPTLRMRTFDVEILSQRLATEQHTSSVFVVYRWLWASRCCNVVDEISSPTSTWSQFVCVLDRRPVDDCFSRIASAFQPWSAFDGPMVCTFVTARLAFPTACVTSTPCIVEISTV